MYRTCIFCSADLGSNEAVEEFPVGRSLAFDAWKGRLWAVCPKCGRWNLAPIDERWEAVESAEKQFVDARLRVQSENIGLAKLRDGTRLIRVGKALPGELAAWRYGTQLTRRRTRYLVTAAAAITIPIAVFGGLAAAGVAIGGMGWVSQAAYGAWQRRRRKRVVHRIGETETGAQTRGVLRLGDLDGARIIPGQSQGIIAVRLPAVEGGLVLQGPEARTVLTKTMVHANAQGASRKRASEAVALLGAAGSADAYLDRVARRDARILPEHGVRRYHQYGEWGWSPAPVARLSGPESLALEMALHEESERRALEGELAALEAAWREAEEIAHIADYLPDEPPE